MKLTVLLIFLASYSQCSYANDFLKYFSNKILDFGKFLVVTFDKIVHHIKVAIIGEPVRKYPPKDKFIHRNKTKRTSNDNSLKYITYHTQSNLSKTSIPNKKFKFPDNISTFDVKYILKNNYEDHREEHTADKRYGLALPSLLSAEQLNKTKNDKDERNPLLRLSIIKLAAQHGYILVEHEVTSSDGYIITLHRLSEYVHESEILNRNKAKNETILLHHGLLGSSADWLILGRNFSLAYLLFDMGYDVWLFNARGNMFSRKHAWKKITSPEFWQFTWQEIGWYDLSASVYFIQKIKSSVEPITYIGYSMGSSSLIALLSTFPNYNKYFKIGILMAPLIYMSHTESPLKLLIPLQLSNSIYSYTGEFSPEQDIDYYFRNVTCTNTPDFCYNSLFYLTGGFPDNFTGNSWNRDTKRQIIKQYVPSGGSSKTILHYAQLATTEKFHCFNAPNLEFDLKLVSLPIALISSDGDKFSSVTDALRLYTHLSNTVEHQIIRRENISHTGFLWSMKSPSVVFPKVMDILENGMTRTLSESNEIE